MRGTAILFRIGLLAAGVLGITTVAGACDKPSSVTGSTCSTSKLAATATPAPVVQAAEPSATVGTATNASPAAPGMRAYLDPETGVIGGPGALPPLTEEEAKLLLPEIQEEPVETVLPDGTVTLDLKGLGQEYFILQLDANGQRVVRCVQDPKTALPAVPTSQPQDR